MNGRESERDRSFEDMSKRVHRLDRMTSGMSVNHLTDSQGVVHQILSASGGRATVADSAWTLIAQPGGKAKVDIGTVFTDYDDWENPLEIADKDKIFDIASGRRIWLELDCSDPEALSLTLQSGTEWTGFPKTYQIAIPESGPVEIAKAFFRVWEFLPGPPQRRTDMSLGDFFGRRFLRNPHYLIVWGSRNQSTQGEDRQLAPVLVPLS